MDFSIYQVNKLSNLNLSLVLFLTAKYGIFIFNLTPTIYPIDPEKASSIASTILNIVFTTIQRSVVIKIPKTQTLFSFDKF